jgi:hypothetical protein
VPVANTLGVPKRKEMKEEMLKERSEENKRKRRKE